MLPNVCNVHITNATINSLQSQEWCIQLLASITWCSMNIMYYFHTRNIWIKFVPCFSFVVHLSRQMIIMTLSLTIAITILTEIVRSYNNFNMWWCLVLSLPIVEIWQVPCNRKNMKREVQVFQQVKYQMLITKDNAYHRLQMNNFSVKITSNAILSIHYFIYYRINMSVIGCGGLVMKYVQIHLWLTSETQKICYDF